ncbi:hypothetical protein B0A54_06909 [Friedmanniomyces endolithicus]|uniref:Uncharacterized protein n=1 Tax=Friedmanniomyces endolithicus TaxID=329885 RepID=A0A4V5NAP2_9PEZI|nr:hypothetical protein B0A54_06909 [Friedmanniomyces endolithicus]
MCGIHVRAYRCGHERRQPNICWEARMRPYPRGGNPDPCPGFPDGEHRGPVAQFCCKPACCARQFEEFYAQWSTYPFTQGYDSAWQERQWSVWEEELVALHAGCRAEQDDLYEM